MIELMEGVVVHHLRFEVEAQEVGSLLAQPGSALRGALYGALSRQFCPDQQAVHLPGHKAVCPVCRLLAAEDQDSERGQDLPRPITIEPPASHYAFRAGERWHFGISLIGQVALEAFPHLIRAVQSMGKAGVSHHAFNLIGIEEVHPFGASRSLLNGNSVSLPQMPIIAADIAAQARSMNGERVRLEFLTPLRIGEQKHLCHRPELGVMLRRLIERCQAVAVNFSENRLAHDRSQWREVSLRLSSLAEGVRLTRNDTRWLDAVSGSRRTERTTPIGGLVGKVTWEGNLTEVLPWLLWGQSLHVGKSTVKGNGWYRVVMEG